MTPITLGILGGGQLGRMSALAAARLGIRTVIFTPENNSPASQVSDKTIVAEYENKNALAEFAALVDIISYEFENIPVETVSYLKSLKPVFPDENLLNISQDRLKEKQFLNDIGIQTARWTKVTNETALHVTLEEWKASETIIKTARFGYDGKGQIRYNKSQKLSDAILSLGSTEGNLIAEEIINFKYELSVITARDQDGNMVSYGPMLNDHKNHILDTTTVPAPIDNTVAQEAIQKAETLANEINLRGLLTVEYFVTNDNTLLANEIAPRTHNSGHWSIDACTVSQFENHVRAVCGLPVAPIGRHSDAIMKNLIGEDVLTYKDHLTEEKTCIHLYGKQDIKTGRKLGHITFLKDKK
jgi:5-(carboxyamino)imidazole ribonucleotide synthase